MTGLLTVTVIWKGHLLKLGLIVIGMIHANRHLKWHHILVECTALVALRFRQLRHRFLKPSDFADFYVTKVLHFLQSVRLKNAWTKVCIKDWEWSRCKSHCGACPDAFIPFPFWQKFSCHGDKTKVLDTVGQLNEKMRDCQMTNPLCENNVHFTLTHMAWFPYPCG